MKENKVVDNNKKVRNCYNCSNALMMYTILRLDDGKRHKVKFPDSCKHGLKISKNAKKMYLCKRFGWV